MVIYLIEFSEHPNYFFNKDSKMYERGIDKASIYLRIEDALKEILDSGMSGVAIICAYELKRL